MNRADFERVVDVTLDELPPSVAAEIDNLTVVVEAHPTREQAQHGRALLGLYEGVSLADRGIGYFGALPDRISIFMDAHLALRLGKAATEREVRKTVLHEIGHHLGMDEARLHELGWA